MPETNDSTNNNTTQEGGNTSKTSTASTNISVTNEDHLFVSKKLFEDLGSLKTTFVNIMKELDTAANSKAKSSDDIVVNGDIVCLSDEQVNKGMTNTKKDPLKNLFSQLISAVRPLCTPEYKVSNQTGTTIDIPSVEALVDTKLETLKSNFEQINNKLDILSGSMDLQKRKFSGISTNNYNNETSTPSRKVPQKSDVNVELLTELKDDECHVDETVDNFLTADECAEIETFLSDKNLVYNEEVGHSTLLFGPERYRYSGSRSEKPIEMPQHIKAVMDKLNAKRNENEGAPLNSCLVNKFIGNKSLIKDHGDNEPTIDPKSKIYTISLGSTRSVIFKNLRTGETHVHVAKPASLYTMTRKSQNFYNHQIDPEDEENESVRYSLTFRSLSWRNKNSTLLIGDSNSGKLRFGPEKGCFGKSLPGEKIYVPTIDQIDPLSAVGYSNVVILCGINDIKSRYLTERRDIESAYERLKLKVMQIKAICRGINVVVCPIMPTRLPELNKKARYFNQFIWNNLVPNNWGVSYVWGFDEFLDHMGNLKTDLTKANDYLHLNNMGARVLGRLIKRHFLPIPTGNFTRNIISYSNAAGGGHVGTAEPRSVEPA